MSTVQDLFNSMQFRVDVANTGIYHLINVACRQIARRLFQLDSAIVKSEMAVSIKAVDETYKANTIAFVDGGTAADTITDSADQFVAEGFLAGMVITTDDTDNPGPYRITTVAVGTITVPTGSLTAALAGSDVTISGRKGYGALPSDFGGLISKPYLSGRLEPLLPVPDMETKLLLTGTGLPRYYEIKGANIYTYPPPSSDYTIIADYQAVPATLSAVGNTMPFNGLFDDAIAEAVMRIYRSGEQVIGQDSRWWDFFCRDHVDVIARKYGKASPPPPRYNGINWGGLR
jgi:hypothetical protein